MHWLTNFLAFSFAKQQQGFKAVLIFYHLVPMDVRLKDMTALSKQKVQFQPQKGRKAEYYVQQDLKWSMPKYSDFFCTLYFFIDLHRFLKFRIIPETCESFAGIC